MRPLFHVLGYSLIAFAPWVEGFAHGQSLEFVLTAQPTQLLSLEQGELVELDQVACGNVLSLVSNGPFSCRIGADSYWCVESCGRPAFVAQSDAFSPQLLQGRVESSVQLPSVRQFASRREQVPLLIRVCDERIVEAWTQLAPFYRENDGRGIGSRKPEPYFARGQLWAAAGSHVDAIEEYRKAAALVRRAFSDDPRQLAQYFLVLQVAIDAQARYPARRPIVGAREYWGSGLSHLRSCRLDDAISDLTVSVRLDATEPLYWYTRAVAYRRHGQPELALRDAQLGAEAEAIKERAHESVAHLYSDLSSIQGQDRVWLQRVRAGDAKAWGN